MSEYPREVNDVKPTSLNHIVGQRSVVDQVSVALDAAQMDARPFEHALLVGSSRFGQNECRPGDCC